MIAFSNDYYGMIFRATQSVELFCAYDQPYSESNFVVTVDGFLVSDNVAVENALVLDTGFQWSDHNPVYMDFILLP